VGSGVSANNGEPAAAALTQHAAPAAHAVASASVPSSALSIDRKVKRHARREQLYVAIRDSMTRAGMLSASYKFKVLSLDQNGNEFLVMMDVAHHLTTSAGKLSDTEEIIIRSAKAGYGIVVTAVYWRFDRKTALELVSTPAMGFPAAVAIPVAAAVRAEDFVNTQSDDIPSDAKKRNDPLLEEEVAAFKRALTATHTASAVPAALIAVTVAGAAGKASGVLKSYTLITGFEDTEIPDSPEIPALSATQYGDLN